jgi:hypothetical protein
MLCFQLKICFSHFVPRHFNLPSSFRARAEVQVTAMITFIRMVLRLLTLYSLVPTFRKVAGSIPDEVNFLNLSNPSGRTRPRGLLSL